MSCAGLGSLERSMRWLALFLLSLTVLTTSVALYVRAWYWTPLGTLDQPIRIVVDAGDGFSRVSQDLVERGALSSSFLLDLTARLSGADAQVFAGEYELDKETSPASLMLMLQTGDTVRYLVTLPEGVRLAQALRLLHEADGIRTVLEDATDPRVLEMTAPYPPEGWFLPETYQYERGDTDLKILRQAHEMMARALDDIWAMRDDGLPFAAPYELLTMASIIEKETAVASERAKIGGVFVRRLRQQMRLQTDPAVIYGLGPAFDGDLTRLHLRDEDNPFNTYRHSGLPPTPIALPGVEALRAAAHPETGLTLYFVARGDGSHEFNETLQGHNDAVKKYQLRRRSDYRSTPKEDSGS
ncbi:MAG: endolytic transglycosylase MltG [Pseudomonadota bacterium]